MSDTTQHELPERIWVELDGGEIVIHNNAPDLNALIATGYLTKYTRDDLVQAAVAAALREASERARRTVECCQSCASVEPQILALITPDAQAALDRVVAAALREAINRVSGCDRISEVQPAILALIREGGE